MIITRTEDPFHHLGTSMVAFKMLWVTRRTTQFSVSNSFKFKPAKVDVSVTLNLALFLLICIAWWINEQLKELVYLPSFA